MSQEIFDLFSELKLSIDEFNGLKARGIKNKAVVLYIQLKLEIFTQSSLFRMIGLM